MEKFVIAYDTMCTGNQCTITTNEAGEDVPVLFDTYDEAFLEMFGDALDLNRWQLDFPPNDEDAPDRAVISAMKIIYDEGDIESMKKFWADYPDVNYYEEWVESTETFLLNRKAILTLEGGYIQGAPIQTN